MPTPAHTPRAGQRERERENSAWAHNTLAARVDRAAKVENDQAIGERKNMNLPNVKVDLPVLQPKDIDDLQNFGVPNAVDYVAASFVQSAADVLYIRQILDADPRGKDIKIISKIENQEVHARLTLTLSSP